MKNFFDFLEYKWAENVVAYDVKRGKQKPVYGMGRHNHENTVIVPGGWKWTATLSGDDTFLPHYLRTIVERTGLGCFGVVPFVERSCVICTSAIGRTLRRGQRADRRDG